MTYDKYQWNNEARIYGSTYNTSIPNLRDLPSNMASEKESSRGANMKRVIVPRSQQAIKRCFLHFVQQTTYNR